MILEKLSYQRSPNCFKERPTKNLADLRLFNILTVAMLFVISIYELRLSSSPGVSIIITLFLDQREDTYEIFAHRV